MSKKKKNSEILRANHISLLVEALNCENEGAARLLVRKAMFVASDSSNHWPKENAWSDEDLDAVVCLIRGIQPKDTIEAILAAQFVALHLKAMKCISRDNYNIMGYALSMTRLSHQALNILQQYRGKSQTINVNYNVHSEGDTVLNTLIQEKVEEKIEGKT